MPYDSPEDQEVVTKVLQRYSLAESKRMELSSTFKILGDFVRPSCDSVDNPMGGDTSNYNSKNERKFTRLFDTTLVQANIEHAAGTKSWMCPATQPWFELKAPDQFKMDDEVVSWYATVTDITRRLMAGSNFDTEEHEAILDGGAFGMRALMVDAGKDKPLLFRHREINTFSVLENDEGRIDSVFNSHQFTPRQAVQKFGLDNLPEGVKSKYEAKPGETTTEEYVHAIYPREDAERDELNITDAHLPVASVWIHKSSKCMVRKSGFEEMPMICSRYLKWGGTPYGLPPPLLALADGRQLNQMQMDLDILASVAANPRLLLPDSIEGTDVDLRPGGVTFFSDANNIPRTWGTGGQYDIGQDRVNMRIRSINRAFNLEAFTAFQQRRDKVMTATEVLAIRDEMLDLFSPTFTLMSVEHHQPILQRVFSILLRGGYYPPVPDKLIVDQGNGMGFVPPPQVSFVSKLALALQRVNSAALNSSLQQRSALGDILGPSVFDDIKLDVALKAVDRSNGLPEEWFRKPEEVQQLQQARAEQQQQQAQMQQAEVASKAASNLKGTGILEKAQAAA